jgi:hypothetical protein
MCCGGNGMRSKNSVKGCVDPLVKGRLVMQGDRIAGSVGCRPTMRCDLRFLRNNGHFCEAAPRNHDFMRRTKIPAHGILNSHISEAKTITD